MKILFLFLTSFNLKLDRKQLSIMWCTVLVIVYFLLITLTAAFKGTQRIIMIYSYVENLEILREHEAGQLKAAGNYSTHQWLQITCSSQ